MMNSKKKKQISYFVRGDHKRCYWKTDKNLSLLEYYIDILLLSAHIKSQIFYDADCSTTASI